MLVKPQSDYCNFIACVCNVCKQYLEKIEHVESEQFISNFIWACAVICNLVAKRKLHIQAIKLHLN